MYYFFLLPALSALWHILNIKIGPEEKRETKRRQNLRGKRSLFLLRRLTIEFHMRLCDMTTKHDRKTLSLFWGNFISLVFLNVPNLFWFHSHDQKKGNFSRIKQQHNCGGGGIFAGARVIWNDEKQKNDTQICRRERRARLDWRTTTGGMFDDIFRLGERMKKQKSDERTERENERRERG